jgi:predicted dehydrogenase
MRPLHEISAAVVGTGFIGPVHVEALRRLGIRVSGILGSSAEKSRSAAASLGLSRGYASLKELLEDHDVDVVHIASPNRYHHEQVLACLDAGKHVVCEKPLAMTSAEAAELVKAAKAHADLVTAVNYNIRFYPLCLQARAMIRAGEIGDVLHVTGSYLQDWLLLPTDYNWRVEAGEGGALRAVGDIGTHWLDLIGFITGLHVDSLLADLWTLHSVRRRPVNAATEAFTGKLQSGERAVREIPVETEDYGSILLKFSGGERGALTVSQIAAGRRNCIRFEISGTKKSLAWNSESSPGILSARHRAQCAGHERSVAHARGSAALCKLSGRPPGGLSRYIQAALSRDLSRRTVGQTLGGSVVRHVRGWPSRSRPLRSHPEELPHKQLDIRPERSLRCNWALSAPFCPI